MKNIDNYIPINILIHHIILTVFESEVQEAKDKADRALEEIATIKDMIVTAQNKSYSIKQVLEGSEQNADRAREIAESAKINANNASTMANDIRLQANKTKAEVIKLGLEAEKLYKRVNVTDDMIRHYEEEINKDADVTEQVIFNSKLCFLKMIRGSKAFLNCWSFCKL